MSKKIDVKLEEQIINSYNNGDGANTIARQIGMTNNVVYNTLRRHGIPTRGISGGQQFKKIMTDDKIKLAIEMFDSGVSATTIAKKFDCCRAVVSVALKVAGRELRAGNSYMFTAEQSNKIKSLYEIGISQKKIADQFGVSQPIIGRTLRRLGVPSQKRRTVKRQDHGMWKGGRYYNKDGYVLVMPEINDEIGNSMTNNLGYVQEHRLVMAHKLGRPLTANETVHHIDGDRKNNDSSNLQPRMGKHGKHTAFQCACCGSNDIKSIEIN